MRAGATHGQIVEAADRLFYTRGFEHSSFADIAAAVGISRGNFYHHFKTKDEILSAVIALRLARTQEMLDTWAARTQDPADRVRSFIDMLIANQANIMLHGCPVGTLCSELAKLDHAALPEANALFGLFRDWLSRQFELLGHGEGANGLAMHLLARSQGIATLANAFRDAAFIRSEVAELHAWLQRCISSPPAASGAAGV
jgi:TetR/AcrR family transcriptional regulator, transcriptional repressor for nem operon